MTASSTRAAATATSLGILDSRHRAVVDERGRVTLPGADGGLRSWSIDWWIGGDDRWHLPTRSVSVRQHAIDNSPVIESRFHVPGGDVVHRAYVATAQGVEHLVISVENESTVPAALALVVAPVDDDSGSIGSIALNGAAVTVDGQPGLIGPRPPGRVHLGSGAGESSAFEESVMGGLAEPSMDQAITCADGQARGAFIWPMSHRANMIFTVPLDRPDSDTEAPIAAPIVPEASRVASGWRTQTDRAARVWLPDERLMAAQSVARTQLLLAAPTPDGVVREDWHDRADVLVTLVRWGYHRDAIDGLIASLDHERMDQVFTGVDSRETAAAALTAVGEIWRLDGDPSLARALVEPATMAVERLAERGELSDSAQSRVASALTYVANLCGTAGEKRASKGVRKLADALSAGSRTGAVDSADEPFLDAVRNVRAGHIEGWVALERGLSMASSVWSWPTSTMGRQFLEVVRSLAVVEQPDGLSLVPLRVTSWFGSGLEVHDLPTIHGPLSYAIRWHGDRPALLWELGEPVGAQVPLTLRTGLDPSWSSADRSGEALLEPISDGVVEPGLVLEPRPMNHLPTAQHTGFDHSSNDADAGSGSDTATDGDIDAEGGFL